MAAWKMWELVAGDWVSFEDGQFRKVRERSLLRSFAGQSFVVAFSVQAYFQLLVVHGLHSVSSYKDPTQLYCLSLERYQLVTSSIPSKSMTKRQKVHHPKGGFENLLRDFAS